MKLDRYPAAINAGGFSAIELMTVLVLIGIGVSLAIPPMNGYVERTRTRSALDRVVTDVSFARVYAVQHGRRAALHLQGDGTYTIDTLTTGGSWAPVRTVQLRNDYGGVSITGTVSTLEFSSRGILTSQADEAVLTVSRGEHKDSVFVSPAGRLYRDF